jgi:hypothetical protein
MAWQLPPTEFLSWLVAGSSSLAYKSYPWLATMSRIDPAVFLQQVCVVGAGILRTTVGMVNQSGSTIRRDSAICSALKVGLSSIALSSAQPTRESVQNRGQTHELIPQPDAGDVRPPELNHAGQDQIFRHGWNPSLPRTSAFWRQGRLSSRMIR